MANDAEPYIAAVADACQAAGLHVAQYGSDDIDPRDGTIDIVLRPDADPDEDYRDVRTLAWNEERGWLIGQPKDPHGELHNIYYLGDSELPDPADLAEEARKMIAGEFGDGDIRRMMHPVQWRDQGDYDDFEERLGAYRQDATPEAPGGGQQ